ncbi:calcium-binding protein [Leisingera thetidis]|uniref:calcium-binding protein n=1 Tax=Leisingera thetidis TaxID=2930199 RepID=UPI0021F7F2F7|nr:calcium-binding protein [Leisingera thetidis]
MATFTVTDSSNSWDVRDLQTYRILNATATTVNSNHVVIEGSNSSGSPFSASFTGSFSVFGSSVYGTITSITFQINGSTAFSATGMDVSFTSYSNIYSSSFERDATGGNDLFSITSSRGSSWSLGAGNDTINAGSGSDHIDGGSGTDRLIVDGRFAGTGFSTSYSRVYLDGPDGRDSLTSIELLQFTDRTVSLKAGTASANALNGDTRSATANDVLLGGGGNDSISGLSGRDLLLGEAGNDKLKGHNGNDTLKGGSGHDYLHGGDASDRLSGNDGNDKLIGGTGNDILNGQTGRDTLSGGTGNDSLTGGAGDDGLSGDDGRDHLSGNGGTDSLDGGRNADTLDGGSGSDTLKGGKGQDVLNGQTGRDVLLGEEGDDILTGGIGEDIFAFRSGHGNDTIQDFLAGTDRIQIGRGAADIADLEFQRQGGDVLVSFADVTILVEDITLAQLQDADNFLF